MSFTDAEIEYLGSQRLGRLATQQPNGTLQVSPVGFHYNRDLGTVDIAGFRMSESRKFRNIADNGRVAFVVDDVASVDPWRVRCLEIRGHAEAITDPDDAAYEIRDGMDKAIIRIRPERIISFGIGQTDVEPHRLVANNRDVG